MQVITESSGRRFRILNKLLSKVGSSNIVSFQASNGLTKDGKFGLMSYGKLYNALLSPVSIPFHDYPVGQVFPKNQLVIHHNAGWDNARGMFQDWDRDARKGVCTACGIDDSGGLYRGFGEEFWGHALGVEEIEFRKRGIKNMNNLTLNRQAVQVELCSFGGLTENGNGSYKTWANTLVSTSNADKIPFRGFPAFERYTEKEVETLETWILLNAMRFDIPLDYKGASFWNVNDRALSGEPGVWGHCSFRQDKSDPYPQPQLISMLQNLISYES